MGANADDAGEANLESRHPRPLAARVSPVPATPVALAAAARETRLATGLPAAVLPRHSDAVRP